MGFVLDGWPMTSGPQMFALGWGVLAAIMGFVFARYPDTLASAFHNSIRGDSAWSRFRRRQAPIRGLAILYRVMGVLFAVGGVAVFICALVGVIR